MLHPQYDQRRVTALIKICDLIAMRLENTVKLSDEEAGFIEIPPEELIEYANQLRKAVSKLKQAKN